MSDSDYDPKKFTKDWYGNLYKNKSNRTIRKDEPVVHTQGGIKPLTDEEIFNWLFGDRPEIIKHRKKVKK